MQFAQLALLGAVNPRMTTVGLTVSAEDEPEALLARGLQLPPQPAALQALQMLALTENPEMRDVSEVIASDAALTAGLYRMARSPLFARPSPPQTVEQVVLLLGLPRTLALAQALCVQRAMAGDARVLARFWARSTAIAQLAMLIAAHLPGARRVSGEQAYLAGMFHDCGVPILMQRFPAYCRTTGIEGYVNKWADIRTEDRAFSCDHAVIGFLLARHWRLPDFVAQAVRFHHEGGCIPSRPTSMLVGILQLSMHLYAREMDLTEPSSEYDEGLLLERLEISANEMNELCEQVIEHFHVLER